jgi:hypothetical protein
MKGRENQDMWFAFRDPAGSGTTVFGVLDGHGREVHPVHSSTPFILFDSW